MSNMSKEAPIYTVENNVSVDEYRSLLIDSGLGVRRPVEDIARLESMLRNSNFILTARINDELVGMARAVTDFVFCCYVSDLAVSKQAQGKRIGARLIEETRRYMGPNVSVILSSVPESVGFYQGIQMQPLPNGFWFRREQ